MPSTNQETTPSPKARRRKGNALFEEGIDPLLVRNASDPGDETARNYRYQYAYGVMLMAAAKRGERSYAALWCEHHEDLLLQRLDGSMDPYQIKTSRPENGSWRMVDAELVKSIGRFSDHIDIFGARINKCYFVSNTDFDCPTEDCHDQIRIGRSPKRFLQHIRTCKTKTNIVHPFKSVFDHITSATGCDQDQLFLILNNMEIVLGPSRTEFDASLSHEHLGRIDCYSKFSPEQLDQIRDTLIAVIHRASSLHVTDPIRHFRSLLDGTSDDPTVMAKYLVIEKVFSELKSDHSQLFQFPGDPGLALNATEKPNVLEKKLSAAGLDEEIEYMRERARAAQYHLLEMATRQPDSFSAKLKQIEERVHGVAIEANLRARSNPVPYGTQMLIEVQDRLQHLATNVPAAVAFQEYDCLLGVAALLTDECRIWWGPRFEIAPEVA